MSGNKSCLHFNLLHFRLWGVAFIAFSLISFPSHAKDKKGPISREETQSQLLKGKELYYQNQYDQAIETLTELIKRASAPKILYMALIHRGAARGYLGRKEEALKDFENAFRINARDPFLFYMRAVTVFGSHKEFDRGIADLNQALQLHPNRSLVLSIYLSRSDFHAQKREFNLAREDLKQAICLAPNKAADFLLRSGVSAYYHNQYDQAIETLTQLIANNPTPKILYPALIHRGSARGYLGQKEKALKDFENALRIDARDPFLYYMRAVTVFATKKEFDPAIEDFNYALKLHPNSSLTLSIYLSRSDCYAQKQEFDLARDDLNQAFRLDPHNKSIYATMSNLSYLYSSNGDTFRRKGQYDQAIQYYSEAIYLDPQNPRAFSGRAFAKILLGVKKEAIPDLQTACQLGHQNACHVLSMIKK